jgi:hypothetical protein
MGLAILMLGSLTWGIAQIALRPPDYAEGCLLFNASRLRDGFPLYVDPIAGAREYGEPPSRYFVAYTPLYAAALSVLPAASALLVGRSVGLLAWLAALMGTVATARAECRRAAAMAALFVASSFLFTRWSASAKPDALALLLAGAALTRSIRLERADALAGVLFGLAAVLKPNVIGMGAGALVISLVRPTARRFEGTVAAGVTGALILGGLQVASGGVALRHLRAGLGLAFELRRFAWNLADRSPFVVGLFLLAGVAAWRARRSPSAAMALAALATSTATAFFGLGKLGSASNYLMEPALTSVVLLSRFPLVLPSAFACRAVVAAVVATTLGWSATATARSLAYERVALPRHARGISRVRDRCLLRPGAFVLSDDPGIELAVNGRIHTHAVELWNESRTGRFPETLWVQDVESDQVRCAASWIEDGDPPDTPPGLFPPEVARAMRDKFMPPMMVDGYAIYLARAHAQ